MGITSAILGGGGSNRPTATTTLLVAFAGVVFLGFFSVTSWRLGAYRRRRTVTTSNGPSAPVASYLFPRFVAGILDITMTGIVPQSFLPLPPKWLYKLGHSVYQKFGVDYFFAVDPFYTILYIADADMIREVVTRKTDFPKPIEIYGILDIFGQNVVTTENSEWRRHRRIAAPQFSEKNNMFVHRATVDTAIELFADWDKRPRIAERDGVVDGIEVNVSNDMMKLALHVISSAGFGQHLNWADDTQVNNTDTHGSSDNISGRHTLSFKQSVEQVIENLRFKLAVPAFMYALPIPRIQKMRVAFDEFDAYVREMVRDVRHQTEANLLVSLVKAARADSATNAGPDAANATTTVATGLTEREIVGNIFIFMFAGHETTANALTFALGLLAGHPDKQQRLYEEVKLVLGGKNPTYKQLTELVYSLAIMNETLRLFPPVIDIPKTTHGQQTLGNLIIPDKTRIGLHVIGLHFNPKYWGQDAAEFRPERWFSSKDCASDANKAAQFMKNVVDSRGHASSTSTTTDADDMSGPQQQQPQSIFSYNRFAFIPFSEGVRSCLGKRFSQVEFVTAIAMVSQRYTVHLPRGVSLEQALDTTNRVTLQTTQPLNLIFRPRM